MPRVIKALLVLMLAMAPLRAGAQPFDTDRINIHQMYRGPSALGEVSGYTCDFKAAPQLNLISTVDHQSAIWIDDEPQALRGTGRARLKMAVGRGAEGFRLISGFPSFAKLSGSERDRDVTHGIVRFGDAGAPLEIQASTVFQGELSNWGAPGGQIFNADSITVEFFGAGDRSLGLYRWNIAQLPAGFALLERVEWRCNEHDVH